MINPNSVSLVISQSTTFDKTMTWIDGGKPVDLSDCEIALQVRQRGDNGKVLLTASTLNGMIQVVDATKGTFMFEIPASVTEVLSFTNALYDISVKRGDRVCRIMQGDMLLSVSQTKLAAFS